MGIFTLNHTLFSTEFVLSASHVTKEDKPGQWKSSSVIWLHYNFHPLHLADFSSDFACKQSFFRFFKLKQKRLGTRRQERGFMSPCHWVDFAVAAAEQVISVPAVVIRQRRRLEIDRGWILSRRVNRWRLFCLDSSAQKKSSSSTVSLDQRWIRYSELLTPASPYHCKPIGRAVSLISPCPPTATPEGLNSCRASECHSRISSKFYLLFSSCSVEHFWTRRDCWPIVFPMCETHRALSLETGQVRGEPITIEDK